LVSITHELLIKIWWNFKNLLIKFVFLSLYINIEKNIRINNIKSPKLLTLHFFYRLTHQYLVCRSRASVTALILLYMESIRAFILLLTNSGYMGPGVILLEKCSDGLHVQENQGCNRCARAAYKILMS
jgi:hypothetical protein